MAKTLWKGVMSEKFTVEIDLTNQEKTQLLQNSIERVLHHAEQVALGDGDPQLLLLDLEELIPVTRKIWCSTQNAIFKKQLESEKK